MFPFILDSLHELFEPLFSANVFKERIIFRKKRIAYETSILCILKPIKRLLAPLRHPGSMPEGYHASISLRWATQLARRQMVNV